MIAIQFGFRRAMKLVVEIMREHALHAFNI